MIKIIATLVIFVLPLIFPSLVSAHAFGQLYNLPIPFWMYLYGAAAAIVVSFLLIGYFFKNNSSITTHPKRDITNNLFIHFLISRGFVFVLKCVSIFLLFLTISTGFFGTEKTNNNFNMTFFWIIFVLGGAYLTAIFGNLWAILNPLKIIADVIETLWHRKIHGNTKYPETLGYYPALLFYFVFIWIELFFGTTPFTLSLIIVSYLIINLYGIFIYGKNDWLRYCEFFSVFFRLIGKIAPIAYEKKKLYLRPPLVGLITDKAEHVSLLLFIIFMLSSTAFDGLYNTRIYYGFFPTLNTSLLFPTLALIFSLVVFLLIYLLLMFLAKVLTKSPSSLQSLSLPFGFSLIPIALAYNIAHYYTLLLIEGQNIIRLISNPFGFQWNLFHTAQYEINYRILDMNSIWHTQVGVILVGHIAAVYLAHIIALRTFPTQTKVLLSQIPMLILMVVYTTIGLWILAQHISNS